VSYEWREHTAEVELVVTAGSVEGVFAEVADAFGRFVELDTGGDAATRIVELVGSDRGALLVGFLEELIYLADTDGFVPDDSTVQLSGNKLSVELRGRTTTVQPIVKAATYHNLAFEEDNGSWCARVVLDV
jgi:SHS2 domain-containing protein